MEKIQIELVCVDFQNEFTDPKGRYYVQGTSVEFIKSTLIPYLKVKSILISEIISDYRQPRHSKSDSYCIPGEFGYLSNIPNEVKKPNSWIKSMHNPTWIRSNNHNESKNPHFPHPDPQAFTQWLNDHVGIATKDLRVVIFGETLDVCVYALAQELYHRGYNVYILYEATDPMFERHLYKHDIAYHSGLSVYATIIHFDDLKHMIDNIERKFL